LSQKIKIEILDNLKDLVERVYCVLNPEELFSRAKEYSWQTFFHHSASVAVISYRLAHLYKDQVYRRQEDTIARNEIEWIERRYNIPLEMLAFLVGLVHDYVKLFGIQGERGRKRAEEILYKLLREHRLSEESLPEIVDTVILLAEAVEGRHVPELKNMLLAHVAPIARIADLLVSADSVDEAIHLMLSTSRITTYVKLGYVKALLPSILQAKVSEKIVDVLREHRWTPLVLYYDGLVLIGDEKARVVPIRKVVEALREEVTRVFSVEEQVEHIVSRLSKKKIATIYSYLAQTQGKEILEGEDPTIIYHNLIVKYLAGTPISELLEISSLTKGKKRLLDPRTLATGLEGSGSKYFDEYLSTMMTTKEALARAVFALKQREDGRQQLFLILSYMTAFPSKREDIAFNILERAFGIKLPRKVDKDLLYAVAMAEVYKNLDNDNVVKRIIGAAYDELGGSQSIDYYISRFVLTSIKSNIIDSESANVIDVLTGIRYRNYCRICGTPLLSESIAFIEYARAAGARGGGGSEIWLHDDPPLASLEAIATSKESRIRFICPLCYYEAKKLGEEYKPPLLVIALHPVVAYDVWLWFVERLEAFRIAAPSIMKERTRQEMAKTYKEIMESESDGYKVCLSDSQTSASTESLLRLVDFLGARIIIPLETDMSLKKKDIAQALVLIPFAMSAAGGGQVGIVSNLAQAHNLGSGELPIVLPHHVPLLYEINRLFESIKVKASFEGRQMTPEEYGVYNKSYITILKALYIYSIKVLSWYSGWSRKRGGGEVEFRDYALSLLEYMSSIPHVPLALTAPPPPSLDPREEDELLPYYGLISQKSQEVEFHMSQVLKSLEGREPALNRSLYKYARTLREMAERELSKHAVQKPLRRAIEFIVEFAPAIGYEDARRLAGDKFITTLETSLGVNLANLKKKMKDKDGTEKEVSYAQLLQGIFNDISDIIIDLMQKLPPTKLSKLIETMLDAAYEKYKSVKE